MPAPVCCRASDNHLQHMAREADTRQPQPQNGQKRPDLRRLDQPETRRKMSAPTRMNRLGMKVYVLTSIGLVTPSSPQAIEPFTMNT
jgi:hypothetical protein